MPRRSGSSSIRRSSPTGTCSTSSLRCTTRPSSTARATTVNLTLTGALVGVSLLVSPTLASAARINASPIAADGVQLRYNRSVPTLQRDDDLTTITVTPLPLNHGRLSFAVAAFNKARGAFNLGAENVTATLTDGTGVRIFTKDDLVKQAKTRAMWAQIGMAVATGLAAGAVASSAGRHSYNSTMYTPHGIYQYNATYVNET